MDSAGVCRNTCSVNKWLEGRKGAHKPNTLNSRQHGHTELGQRSRRRPKRKPNMAQHVSSLSIVLTPPDNTTRAKDDIVIESTTRPKRNIDRSRRSTVQIEFNINGSTARPTVNAKRNDIRPNQLSTSTPASSSADPLFNSGGIQSLSIGISENPTRRWITRSQNKNQNQNHGVNTIGENSPLPTAASCRRQLHFSSINAPTTIHTQRGAFIENIAETHDSNNEELNQIYESQVSQVSI